MLAALDGQTAATRGELHAGRSLRPSRLLLDDADATCTDAAEPFINPAAGEADRAAVRARGLMHRG
jgi:hypothetical protein